MSMDSKHLQNIPWMSAGKELASLTVDPAIRRENRAIREFEKAVTEACKAAIYGVDLARPGGD